MTEEPIRDFATDIEMFPFTLKETTEVAFVPSEYVGQFVWCRIVAAPPTEE